MSRKINNKQQLQINRKKDQILKKFDANDSSLSEGIVICRFGKQVDILTCDGKELRCAVRRTVKSITTGDIVLWHYDESTPDNGGIVELVRPRNSELLRPDFYDGLKPIAANITRIFIQSSIVPEFSTNIIDRYIIASEQSKIKPVIIVNKIDLLNNDEYEALKTEVSVYLDLGYTVHLISTKTGFGIEELKKDFIGNTSVIVGQSGVGKSSLINTILGKETAITNAVSENSNLGQHTTTFSRLYLLDNNTRIIDSPGVREFGLWHLQHDKIATGYKEFRKYIGTCKFKDCTHINEIGCSIKEAVSDGEIAKLRYNNYVKILSSNAMLLEKNKTRRANTNIK